MVTYQTETWAEYFRDCQALWREHYDEIAVSKDRMPMRPDVAAYEALERAGSLVVLVARDAGAMVGYSIGIVRPHLHYADVLCGYEDAYFLTESHRRGRTGIRLIHEMERAMQARGCRKLFFATKVAANKGSIFARLGYEPTDIVYSKWVGS